MSSNQERSPDYGRVTPETLRAEIQQRDGSGYIHHASVRMLMRRLADHMEAMAAFGSGVPEDAPLPPGSGDTP